VAGLSTELLKKEMIELSKKTIYSASLAYLNRWISFGMVTKRGKDGLVSLFVYGLLGYQFV